MNHLSKTRIRFILAATILGGLSIILLCYLLWPGTSESVQSAKHIALQRQFDGLNKDLAVWHGTNPAKVKQDLQQLYEEDVPVLSSQISQHLDKLVQATGVVEQSIHYSPDPNDRETLTGIQRIKIETTVSGDYTKIAHFINALEQDPFLFIIEQISLSSQEGGTVQLQITLNTFMKETP